MAYTYNDVQHSKAVHALEDAPADAVEENMDLDTWASFQKAFMLKGGRLSADMGDDSISSAADQSAAHISAVGQAALRLSTTQAVANVHVQSNNFVRDSITGK